MEKTVAELFAGVGGFRVGLNEVSLDNEGKTQEKPNFQFVWMNQWEPSTKVQHAFECYQKRFGKSDFHSNTDIALVDKKSIPQHTLLVGGFPCQDYSVARTLSNERGIEGKKGVLWWEIHKVLHTKRPPFLLLENVDRLLKSPSSQRGRDFGIMLRSLNDLGYGVEWRIINAADYGHVQRRRRVFIFGFHKRTEYFKKISENKPMDIIGKVGVFSEQFPILHEDVSLTEISLTKKNYVDLVSVSKQFSYGFKNSGIALRHKIFTHDATPMKEDPKILKDVIIKTDVPEQFFLDGTTEKYKYLKGAKNVPRTNKNSGITYNYSEGKMGFPDSLDLPARTMLTSEGSVNRSTHVIEDIKTKKYRILTPVEIERINEFPDNWTNTGMPLRKRYFMMGNALVCGVITKLGHRISQIIDSE
jgi:DNA (cytosine-5)-methyltransferase 1